MVFVDDVDAERVPDGVSPIVEGALGQSLSAADVDVALPAFVQGFEGDFFTLVDCFDYPDVFADKILVGHFVVFLEVRDGRASPAGCAADDCCLQESERE